MGWRKSQTPTRQIKAPWHLRWRSWCRDAQLVYLSSRFGAVVKVTYAEQWEDPWGNVTLRAQNPGKKFQKPGPIILMPDGTLQSSDLHDFAKWCPYDREQRAAMMLTWGGSDRAEQDAESSNQHRGNIPGYMSSLRTF